MITRSPLARLLTAVTLCCGSFQSATAETSTVNALTHADNEVEYKSRLWRIEASGEHGSRPVSWLFGTLHVENPEVLKLADPLAFYLDETDQLVLEVDTTALTRRSYEEHLFLEDDKSLRAIIGIELFERTLNALAKNGMTADALDRYRPFAPILALASPESRTGLFLDEKIRRLASVRNKEITGIETLAEQMGILANMSLQDQIALLDYAVQTHADFDSDLQQLVDIYRQGDVGSLLELSRKQMNPPDPLLAARFEKRLLFDRNRIMVARLVPILKDKSSFIAIGAAHLAGKEGVIALLRQQGFRVLAVPNP